MRSDGPLGLNVVDLEPRNTAEYNDSHFTVSQHTVHLQRIQEGNLVLKMF